MAAPHVFVSHSHLDDAFTRRLVDDLIAAGADVWVDVAGVGADDFQDRINQALVLCEWFVLVLTPSALRSPWVKMEVHAAIRLKVQERMRAVIQLLAEPVPQADIPPTWGTFNHFDATGDYPAARDRVLDVLGLPPLGEKPWPIPQQAPEASSRVVSPPDAPQRMIWPRYGMTTDDGSYLLPERLASLGFEGHTIGGIEIIVPPLCAVPAGEFLMGSDKRQDNQASDDELPQHRVSLPAFQIARFPVTVAEYACFVRTGRREPRDWQTQLGKLDHPVVSFPWLEAAAYAAWLAKTTGQPWRLPTEAEWEKAARGSDGRIYPWGNAFDQAWCNTSESGKRRTTPVGSHPTDISPCGAQDMAGNVWEWTSTAYKPYPYSINEEREAVGSSSNRVLRGGSWNYNARLARTAFRGYIHRIGLYGTGGFRLVCTV